MPDPRAVEARVIGDGAVEEVDDVGEVHRAHRLTDDAPMLAAVAGRSAGVAVDDRVAGVDEHLRLVEQMDAV